MKNILIAILLLVFYSCSEKINERITEKYESGKTKISIKYTGEGSKEKIIERLELTENGDTLKWEDIKNNYAIERRYNKDVLTFKGQFKDKKPIGEHYRYFNNGQLRTKKTYLTFGEELLDGEIIEYYENGNMKSKDIYENQIVNYNVKSYKVIDELPTQTYSPGNYDIKCVPLELYHAKYREDGTMSEEEIWEYYEPDLSAYGKWVVKGLKYTTKTTENIYHKNGDLRSREYTITDDVCGFTSETKKYVNTDENDLFLSGTMYEKVIVREKCDNEKYEYSKYDGELHKKYVITEEGYGRFFKKKHLVEDYTK